MRAVLTRVKYASVVVNEVEKRSIGPGFLILLGVGPNDTEKECDWLADKLCSLRIFEDENEKLNIGLTDVGGEIMVISQFTLYGNCKKGRRPDFIGAAKPDVAIPLYERFVQRCRDNGYRVATGEFGAYMQVESLNDGPVTIVVDTEHL